MQTQSDMDSVRDMDQEGAAARGHEFPAREKDESTGAPQCEGDTTKRTKNFQPTIDTDQEGNTGSMKKFFVQLSGETQGAHEDWVSIFETIGQSEVKSLEESDYILLFCPNMLRVQTDIDAALDKIQDGKKVILILMHPTHDPNYTTGDSKGLVKNRDVVLVVDSLFFEGRLLKSDVNDLASSEIKRFFGDPKENLWDYLFLFMGDPRKYWRILITFLIADLIGEKPRKQQEKIHLQNPQQLKQQNFTT